MSKSYILCVYMLEIEVVKLCQNNHIISKIDAELEANLIMNIKIKIDLRWLCSWGVIVYEDEEPTRVH